MKGGENDAVIHFESAGKNLFVEVDEAKQHADVVRDGKEVTVRDRSGVIRIVRMLR